jgi:DNA-binding MarR family transcriptional regulator
MQRKYGVRAIECAMAQIARNLGRRDLGLYVERRLGSTVDGAHILVVDAIDACGEATDLPTIGDVAKYLDVHPSRASRMVKSAIRGGIIMRQASQVDGRKSCLELSARGHEIAVAIRGARARYFARRMKGWTTADRQAFATLLIQFAQSDEAWRSEHSDRTDNERSSESWGPDEPDCPPGKTLPSSRRPKPRARRWAKRQKRGI